MAGSLQNSQGRAPPERRATRRFPIVVALEYKAFRGRVLVLEGTGRTINIASKGILFHADRPLEPDFQLEVSLDWPTRHESTNLRLHALGQIVRLREDEVAIRLLRPEFQKKNQGELSFCELNEAREESLGRVDIRGFQPSAEPRAECAHRRQLY
jgi:hypothetical protein